MISRRPTGRTDVRGLHGHDGGLAVEGRELDLERLSVLVGVNDGPDAVALQAFLRDGRRQDDAVELFVRSRRPPRARIPRRRGGQDTD